MIDKSLGCQYRHFQAVENTEQQEQTWLTHYEIP